MSGCKGGENEGGRGGGAVCGTQRRRDFRARSARRVSGADLAPPRPHSAAGGRAAWAPTPPRARNGGRGGGAAFFGSPKKRGAACARAWRVLDARTAALLLPAHLAADEGGDAAHGVQGTRRGARGAETEKKEECSCARLKGVPFNPSPAWLHTLPSSKRQRLAQPVQRGRRLPVRRRGPDLAALGCRRRDERDGCRRRRRRSNLFFSHPLSLAIHAQHAAARHAPFDSGRE